MNKEKLILDNLGHSEDWFVDTFARLKVICGQSLHQIDFKDYQQLHSVLKNRQNCELLLKD
jgi:UDP-glucose 4-epimerase